jgi:ankyrin repeat protein
MELHDAVYHGEYSRVETAMAEYRGNPLVRDCSMVTAAALGHYDIVSLLLERNVPPDSNLIIIAFRRKWETRKIKVLHYKIMRDMSSYTKGWVPHLSAACVAAFYGHKNVLKLLFDNGADMEFDPYSCSGVRPHWNPLSCALIGQQIEVAKILLRMNIKMTDIEGQVPTLMHILLWRIPSVLVDHALSYL